MFFLCVTPCGHSLFGKTFVPTDKHSFAAHKTVTYTHTHLNRSEYRKYLIGSFCVGSRPLRQNNIKKNYIYSVYGVLSKFIMVSLESGGGFSEETIHFRFS